MMVMTPTYFTFSKLTILILVNCEADFTQNTEAKNGGVITILNSS